MEGPDPILESWERGLNLIEEVLEGSEGQGAILDPKNHLVGLSNYKSFSTFERTTNYFKNIVSGVEFICREVSSDDQLEVRFVDAGVLNHTKIKTMRNTAKDIYKALEEAGELLRPLAYKNPSKLELDILKVRKNIKEAYRCFWEAWGLIDYIARADAIVEKNKQLEEENTILIEQMEQTLEDNANLEKELGAFEQKVDSLEDRLYIKEASADAMDLRIHLLEEECKEQTRALQVQQAKWSDLKAVWERLFGLLFSCR
jgi:hypothetical protein